MYVVLKGRSNNLTWSPSEESAVDLEGTVGHIAKEPYRDSPEAVSALAGDEAAS